MRVCTDPLCGDDSPEGILSCPAFLYSPDSRYLIDAHESGGGFPVFYFSRAVSSSFNENEFEGGNDFITLGNYAIFHYDVASNERKAVVSQNDPIVDFAVFGDRIFFVSSDKDGKYKVMKVADKLFVGTDLLHIAVFQRGDDRTVYNVVYRDGKKGT